MGAFIARQPNGLLCRFSSIVDSITDYNMSEDDYIELCAERARAQARLELERGVKPFQWVLDQFRPMNDTVEQFNEYLKMVGSDVQLDTKDYDYEED